LSTAASSPCPLDARDLRRLQRWGRDNERVFPWRQTTDQYVVAVTELMLIRTRAAQVASIWEKFFRRFPTLESLAAARDGEVGGVLRPLGLHWRSDRIAAFARAAAEWSLWTDHMGEIPGLGPYVAAAVIVARDGRGLVPIDVTIARVIARYLGLAISPDSRRDRRVVAAASQMGSRSRSFFHAWLDLAAAVCTPSSPRCTMCPLRPGCKTAPDRPIPQDVEPASPGTHSAR
jgi:A/G-specific adenine glycosylase